MPNKSGSGTRVLLIGSLLLGNATATRRFIEILSAEVALDLTVVTFDQNEIDYFSPSLFGKHLLSLAIRSVVRAKLQPYRHDDFDIIICVTIQPVLAVGGLFRNASLVVWYDSLPPIVESGFLRGLIRKGKRLIYNLHFSRIAGLLPMSEWARNQARSYEFTSLMHMEICYVGLDLARWTPEDRSRSSRDYKPRILFVGNDLHRKGIYEFFEYAIEARESLDQFKFVFVTKEHSDRLMSLCNHIDFEVITNLSHDSLENLIEIYRQSDVLFLPTKADMLPHVILEALASKLYIISADVGAISEVVIDSDIGRLVPPQDWPGFYRALCHYADVRPQAKPAQTHLDKFSHQRFRESVLNIISKVRH